MWDYLNEFLFFASRTKMRNEYKRAVMWKRTAGRMIFNSLCHDWISRFEWKTSENTIATELIERTILYGGCVGFARISPYPEVVEYDRFFGEDKPWLNAVVTGRNNLGYYRDPTNVMLLDYVGRQKGRFMPVMRGIENDGLSNCAIVYDNYVGINPIMNIMYYTDRLLDIDTSIRACIKNILGTTLIGCSEEQAKTIRASREAAEIGVPYVLTYDGTGLNLEAISLMTTPGAAEELKTLYEASDKVKADFLQSIGVRVNNEMDRRSGITPIEIVENRQNIDISINAFLKARKRGIEDCKKIGLEISVSTSNMESTISSYDSQGNKIEAGGGDGNVGGTNGNNPTTDSDDV